MAHAVTLRALALLPLFGTRPISAASCATVMGLRFPNRLGVAAGFDKNGIAVKGLGSLGFGFVEVGTVTPRAQSGQAKPRLFRLPQHEAVINRMGFPNDGAVVVAKRLRAAKYFGVIGANIGKNADTPLNDALQDYIAALQAVRDVADYVAVNISSPNTKGLRDLHDSDRLKPLIAGILKERDRLDAERGGQTPVLLKISPDMGNEALRELAELLCDLRVDGVIATNSTTARSAIADDPLAMQAGGLSGRPLHDRAVVVVRQLRQIVGDRMAIVGVGGVDSPEAAAAMRAAGADLVQLYTGMVYQGPGVVWRITAGLT
jgi:dihydroorotate dehydrogenase